MSVERVGAIPARDSRRSAEVVCGLFYNLGTQKERLFDNPDHAEPRSTNLVLPPLLRKLHRIDPSYRN